ncbi:unnamed protein product [Brassica oleracea]
MESNLCASSTSSPTVPHLGRTAFLDSTIFCNGTVNAQDSCHVSNDLQRNSALHLNGFTNTEVTLKTIDREVRNTITAQRHKKTFKYLMSLWIR